MRNPAWAPSCRITSYNVCYTKLLRLPSLSSAIQAKVLTAIEDRTIRRIGGTRQIAVDVRVIAATNRDLRVAVESGEFREDLLP